MRRLAILALAPFLLGGCLLNDAHELRGPAETLSPKSAVIIFGAKDDKFNDAQWHVILTFSHFSLETGQITGNCFHWDRLEIERPVSAGEVHYFAFRAPPGPYVLQRTIDDENGQGSQLAFHAPAGSVTYFGDFWEEGGDAPYYSGRIVRYVDAPAAAAFAASHGLPAPELARQTPLSQPVGMFVCTP